MIKKGKLSLLLASASGSIAYWADHWPFAHWISIDESHDIFIGLDPQERQTIEVYEVCNGKYNNATKITVWRSDMGKTFEQFIKEITNG